MNEERYYQGIKMVQILEDVAAVNDALVNGWTILRIPDVSTQTIEPSGKVYVICRPQFIIGWSGPLSDTKTAPEKPQGPIPRETSQTARTNSNDVAVPSDIPWKAYSKGPGSWAFANNKGLEKLAAALKDRKDHTLTLGEWKYKPQGPEEDPQKFVSRYPHKEGAVK